MIKVSTIQTHIFYQNDNKTEYLILKRSSKSKKYSGMWQVVTGKIEKDEKAFQAAYREADEESGLEFTDFCHVPYIGSFYDARKDKIQNIPVFAAKSKTKDVVLSHEHSDYKWVNYNDIFDYLELPSHIEGTKFLHDYILKNNKLDNYRIYI